MFAKIGSHVASYKDCIGKYELELLVFLPVPPKCMHTRPGLYTARDRTQGFILARQILYQLSHISSPGVLLCVFFLSHLLSFAELMGQQME